MIKSRGGRAMFYRIEKDRVEETSAENWESGQSGVAVFTHKE